jgi:hypothetical protein
MAEPRDLGPRTATGAADPGNPLGAGNWTVSFPPSVLTVQQPTFEVHHIALSGPGGYFEVYRNEDFWDTSLLGSQNSWDPSQPLLLRPGDTLNFYWSVATGAAPKVTLWLRYNPSL